MIYIYWALGILFVAASVVTAIGVYEFFAEGRDVKRMDLHMKHFLKINS